MPKSTDWENTEQLKYVLLHEYVHICRFDVLTKLICTFALCVHWFNPAVWVMSALFNHDIYKEYRDILQSELFSDNDRKDFESVNKKMDDVTAYTAVKSLCTYLQKYYGKKVIILLDEYNTPMQESWLISTIPGQSPPL